MSRFSKNKPAAWTLLSFLTGKQGMKIWTSKGLALPSRSDVKAVSGRGALLKQAGYSHPWQFAPGFADVMTVAGNELQSVIKGSESVSTMLQKIPVRRAASVGRRVTESGIATLRVASADGGGGPASRRERNGH